MDENIVRQSPSYENIYEKLKFIIIFRPLASSIIILAFIISGFLKFFSSVPGNIIYIFLTLIIFITFLYSAVLKYAKNRENLKFLVYFGIIQLSFDFAFISIIVLYSGGLSSRLIFLFYLLILTGGFLFLNAGALITSVASAIVIGIIADLQYYFNFEYHSFFVANPDRLLFLASINILGVLIVGSFLYHFSNGIKVLSKKIIERDEFIRNSQNFNMELINSFSQGIIVLNENYAVVFINQASIRILNLDNEADIFLNKAGILHNFDMRITDIINNFPVHIFNKENEIESKAGGGRLRTGDSPSDSLWSKTERFEVKHRDKILGFTLTKFSGNKVDPEKYILLFRDISFIKQSETESKINEALITAGKFAGWMAHEIRNPLLAINTSIDVLQTAGKTGDRQDLQSLPCSGEAHAQNLNFDDDNYKKLTGIIKDETVKLNNLVNDFLHFIKMESNIDINGGRSSNSEKFNLYEIIEDLIFKSQNHFNEKIKINLYNRIDQNVAIYGKKYRIQQAFVNILQNAVQSIKRKENKRADGIVRFGSKLAETANNNGNAKLVISIADNGEGMDDFVLKNAFTPLFTTKENGFGLGLPLVKSIIEDFEGEIKIISRVGEGTLIKIILPV